MGKSEKKSSFVSAGDVVPVGGTRDGVNGPMPIIPGDSYLEPLSNQVVQVGGAYLSESVVLPSSGGYQQLLDASVLACEARVMDAVRQYMEGATGMYQWQNIFVLQALWE